MKNHVTSLELSKELDKLLPDNKENCNFYWHKGKLVFPHSELGCHAIGDWDEYYPAYLSSELGEILNKVGGTNILKSYRECGGNNYDNTAQVMVNIIDINFLAKMLIFLIKNNLIKL